MHKAQKSDLPIEQRLTITTAELQILTGLGRKTAVELGKVAGAECWIGRRQFWNVQKIREYLYFSVQHARGEV